MTDVTSTGLDANEVPMGTTITIVNKDIANIKIFLFILYHLHLMVRSEIQIRSSKKIKLVLIHKIGLGTKVGTHHICIHRYL